MPSLLSVCGEVIHGLNSFQNHIKLDYYFVLLSWLLSNISIFVL